MLENFMKSDIAQLAAEFVDRHLLLVIVGVVIIVAMAIHSRRGD